MGKWNAKAFSQKLIYIVYILTVVYFTFLYLEQLTGDRTDPRKYTIICSEVLG